MTVVTAIPLKASEVPTKTIGKLAILSSPKLTKEVNKRLSEAFTLSDIVTKPLSQEAASWFLSFLDERKRYIPLKQAFQEYGLIVGSFSLKLFIAYFFNYGQSDVVAIKTKKAPVPKIVKKRWINLLSNLASEKTTSFTPRYERRLEKLPMWFFRHIYVNVSSKAFQDFVKIYKALQNEIQIAESLYSPTGLRRKGKGFVDMYPRKLSTAMLDIQTPPPVKVDIAPPSEGELPIQIVSPTPPERPPIIPNDQKRQVKIPPSQCLHLRTVFATGGKLVCLDCDSVLNV